MYRKEAEKLICACELGRVAGKRVLDIGCGNSSGCDPFEVGGSGPWEPGLARLLAENGADVTGIDLHPPRPGEPFRQITADLVGKRLIAHVSGEFDIVIATHFFNSPTFYDCISSAFGPYAGAYHDRFVENIYTDASHLLRKGGVFIEDYSRDNEKYKWHPFNIVSLIESRGLSRIKPDVKVNREIYRRYRQP